MKKTKIIVSEKTTEAMTESGSVYFIDEEGSIPQTADKLIKRKIEEIIELGDFKGKKAETAIIYHHTEIKKKSYEKKRIIMVGIGKKKGVSDTQLYDNLRRAGGAAAKIAEKYRLHELQLHLPEYVRNIPVMGAEFVVEGLLLGDYRFEKYKKEDDEQGAYSGITKVVIVASKNNAEIRRVVKRAKKTIDSVHSARDMANEPGNGWTPQKFADFAREMTKQYDLKCTIFGKERIKKEGMGGILAVNQGSAVPPQLVILEHIPKKYSKTILLVGKGLTFDSGGISLKPAAGMQDMKYDMCGGAAVISAMSAVSSENPDVRVVAIVPATENLSGAKAVKPGDIIKHYNGITSEVINTDAEGRLILADALSYGVKKYSPDCVVDLATLTGAVIVALGHHRTGLMSNDDRIADSLVEAGDFCGEPMWRLPLDEEYVKQIKSDVADIKNVGGKEGGSITAAAYLQKFVDEVPWAHLDIAGTAWDFTKKEYIPKGPSGIGVRTLIHFIRNWKKINL